MNEKRVAATDLSTLKSQTFNKERWRSSLVSVSKSSTQSEPRLRWSGDFKSTDDLASSRG